MSEVWIVLVNNRDTIFVFGNRETAHSFADLEIQDRTVNDVEVIAEPILGTKFVEQVRRERNEAV